MKRRILLMLGWLSVALGMIGVFLPILPTTPFLLLAAYLFTGQSKKYEEWLVSSKIYKRYALPYKQQRGLTVKKKIEVVSVVYIMLFISGVMIDHLHVRLLLVVVAVVKLIVIIMIPTIREGKVVHDSKRNA